MFTSNFRQFCLGMQSNKVDVVNKEFRVEMLAQMMARETEIGMVQFILAMIS